MPKPLFLWLQGAAQSWQLTGRAHKLDHGGIWHRGDIGGWANCGRAWLGEGLVRMSVGKGCKYRNPWNYNGRIDLATLCHHGCFADEFPLLVVLDQAAKTHDRRMVDRSHLTA